jgi:hypothetical protein
MSKGAGLPYILANAVLGEDDIPGIQTYFRRKMKEHQRDLSKSQIQAVEVWAIEVFREMPVDSKGQFLVMDYLKRLSLYFNEYYVESKNALLRTEKELRIVDEEPVNPGPADVTALENSLSQTGFGDREDLYHIVACTWLKTHKGYLPIFATADRKLYEQKDIIYEKTGVIVEDALYVIGTYRSLVQKTWHISKVK